MTDTSVGNYITQYLHYQQYMHLLNQAFSRVYIFTPKHLLTWALSSQYNDMSQWLQIELREVKKITGIVTQGAKSLRKEMFVTSFSLQYSDNGKHWNHYSDDEGIPAKVAHMNHIITISYSLFAGLYFNLSLSLSLCRQTQIFMGNTNNSDHVKNYMYPPIFSRFIRIVPKSWRGSITMRVELLGCECE